MQPKDTTGLTPVSIPLYGRDGSIRAYTLVDASDALAVGTSTWRLHALGYAYRRVTEDGRRATVLLHRALLGLAPGRYGPEGDHINRDRLDNRRSNLRVVPHSGNMQNTPSRRGATSSFRGVHWHSRDRKWRARIKVNGKDVDLGQFSSEADAAEAARLARMRFLPFATD